MRRLSGRRVCVKNQHNYHVEFNPPKHADRCDLDGSRLVQRDDDKDEVVKHRLEEYHAKTEPLIGYYEEQGILRRIDGSRSSDQVSDQIRATLAVARFEEQVITEREQMIIRKTPAEIESMAAAGQVVARCLDMLRSKCRAGRHDRRARRRGREVHPQPGRRAGLQGLSRLSGLDLRVTELDGGPRHPGDYVLGRGDILSIDVGVELDGWVADAAVTVPVRPVSAVATKLLRATREALEQGTGHCRAGQSPGRRLGCRSGAGRARRLFGDPLARGPRDRPRHARGPAGPELRRARQGPVDRGGDGLLRRADGVRGRPCRADGRRQLGDLLRGRVAHGPLRAHDRGYRGGSADPHSVARHSAEGGGLTLSAALPSLKRPLLGLPAVSAGALVPGLAFARPGARLLGRTGHPLSISRRI